MIVSREDYLSWADHPVSRWLMSAFGSQAEAIRETWIDGAWNNDALDHVAKTRAHARWDILSQISGLEYEEACAFAGQDIKEVA